MDLAIVNVNLFNSLDNRNEAVGIEDGKISIVGSEDEVLEFCSSETEVIDGEGGTLIPGFNDAHTHFASMGVSMSEYLDLGDVKSKDHLLKKVREEANSKEKGEWVVGVNLDESKWSGEKEFMRKEEIDKVAPENPVSLKRVDGHITCVNSRAMSKLDLDPSMEGYEIEDGEPTGRLKEEAGFDIRKLTEPDVDGVKRGIKAAAKKAHSLGITSVQDAHVDEKKFRAYQSLWKAGELPIRANLYFDHELLDDLIELGMESGFGDEKLRVGGLKLFTDGSIGAKTAWVTGGYIDNPDNLGMKIWEPEELRNWMRKAHKNGLQLAIHAIGDRAVSEVIDGMEEIIGKGDNYLRHRIEHCEMISEEGVSRLKDLNVIASMQPNFIGEWAFPGEMYEDRFSLDQVKILDPVRWMADEGVAMAFGSDCMPFDAFYGLHSVVNTPYEAQKLSIDKAIEYYTAGSAFAEFEESRKGKIEKGALADLVLLKDDPSDRAGDIQSFEPSITFLDGEVVFEK